MLRFKKMIIPIMMIISNLYRNDTVEDKINYCIHNYFIESSCGLEG